VSQWVSLCIHSILINSNTFYCLNHSSFFISPSFRFNTYSSVRLILYVFIFRIFYSFSFIFSVYYLCFSLLVNSSSILSIHICKSIIFLLLIILSSFLLLSVILCFYLLFKIPFLFI